MVTDNNLNLNKSEESAGKVSTPEWHVLGAGAVGCLWASKLALAGAAVTLITRDTSLATGKQNIQFRTTGDDAVIDVPVSLQTSQSLSRLNQAIGHLVLATKSYDAVTALASVKQLCSTDTQVICLANGLGFHQQLEDLLSPGRLTVGVTTDGAALDKALSVTHTGHGTTLLGYRQNHLPPIDSLPSIQPAVDLQWQTSNDIESAMWQKFLVNCAINPLTAIFNCDNGELCSNSQYRDTLRLLCVELAAFLPFSPLANKNFDVFQQAIKVAEATAANISSMRRDHQLGRRLELEHLNGYLLTLAKEHAIDCPLNRDLCSQLQAGN